MCTQCLCVSAFTNPMFRDHGGDGNVIFSITIDLSDDLLEITYFCNISITSGTRSDSTMPETDVRFLFDLTFENKFSQVKRSELNKKKTRKGRRRRRSKQQQISIKHI